MKLKEKIAIVTGGSQGIGEAICYAYANEGAIVIIANKNHPEAGIEVANRIKKEGGKAEAIACDVTDINSVKNLIEYVSSKYSRIDILVNNAGIYPAMQLLEMQEKDFDHILAVNLKGAVLCTKAVAMQMITQRRGWKIINITSIDALHPSMVGLATYDASKHGLWGFTKNVALELASHNIWVNAIAPGGIITPGVQGLQKNAPVDPSVDMAKVMEAFMAKIPMHRMGEADEIGKVALFLASDMSSYMTGSQIVVDGGALLS